MDDIRAIATWQRHDEPDMPSVYEDDPICCRECGAAMDSDGYCVVGACEMSFAAQERASELSDDERVEARNRCADCGVKAPVLYRNPTHNRNLCWTCRDAAEGGWIGEDERD